MTATIVIADNTPPQTRNFLYMESRKTWVISKIEDTGLEILMKAAHAKSIEKQRPNGISRYWEVAPEQFDSLRDILIGLGYTEFQQPGKMLSTHASYQVSAIKQNSTDKPQEKTYSVKEISQKMNQVVSAVFPGLVWLKGVMTEFNYSNGLFQGLCQE